MTALRTFSHIKNGKFTNHVAGEIRKFVTEHEGEVVRVEMFTFKKRSLSQNAYLHGVLIPEFKKAMNECGWDDIRTDQDAKDWMKKEFLSYSIVNKKTGEYTNMIKNTSELDTFEMTKFIEDAVKFALESMNYTIYLPNEQSEINLT
jgi:hypothetical protein